jgi:hypothetical protein
MAEIQENVTLEEAALRLARRTFDYVGYDGSAIEDFLDCDQEMHRFAVAVYRAAGRSLPKRVIEVPEGRDDG